MTQFTNGQKAKNDKNEDYLNDLRCYDNLQLNISHSLYFHPENIPSATFPTKSFLSNPKTKNP